MTDPKPLGLTPAPSTEAVTEHPEPPQKSQRAKQRRRHVPERLSRLELHRAHCVICTSKLRDEIDEAFIDWRCVNQIAAEYRLHRGTLYRHAHATGLFARRDRNIRRALGHVIEHAGRVEVTADSIIRAAKIFTHINAHGSWVQPPTHVIHHSAECHRENAKLSETPCQVNEPLNP